MTTVPPLLSTPFSNPITEDDIADYLSNTPDFFQRHAELLAAVQLSSPHSHRAVSLQERQAEMLREKIRSLEARTMEMLRNAADNEPLSNKIGQLACRLLQHSAPHTLPEHITQTIAQLFAVPQVALRVWDVAAEFAQAPFAQGASSDAQLFAHSLAVPFCGRNAGFECVAWLEDPAAAASLALVPLRLHGGGPDQESSGLAPAFGLLVLASNDAQRFSDTMATDFLARIGEMVSAALTRLR